MTSLAASGLWVRYDLELRAGRPELAYAFAHLALELDPGAAEGWTALAAHLAYDRASREEELDPGRRMARCGGVYGWTRCGGAVRDVRERSHTERARTNGDRIGG